MQLKFSCLIKKNLNRAINHLYPLEIPSVVDNESEFNVTSNESVTTGKGPLEESKLVRKAAADIMCICTINRIIL